MASQLQLSLKDLRFKYLECLAYTSAILNHTEYEDPLPYTPIEYIESTGTQYINTGYNPNGNSQYELEITNSTVNGVLFGAYNSTWTDGSGLYTNVGGGYNHWRHYASNTDTGHKSVASEHIIMNKGVLTINDTTYMNSPTASFTVNYPLWVFAGNMKGNVEQPVRCRLHYFKILENNNLLHHFIPVIRKSDSVVCLYDLVTQQFFVNVGTGVFVAGGEV